ncbi:NUDIX hydrolase N-terminal domain-containing protein [Halomarina oriensis]|uniref:NUDIX hydrolase N-terminal domain-containing protein n=1 Tax=Halomarina oriensis TaxID=671145 RepID=UPI001E4D170F|nr:NUDIX hydrolase N-terminal domain-containing protein [Halomarina oriensis]
MADRSPRPLLALLDELQIVARNGLTYGDDPHDHYDRERYERILHVVSEAYARGLDLPADEVRDRLTAEEFGHVTPKVGATAVVTDDDGRVLLIERPESGAWALPGGHAASGETPEEKRRSVGRSKRRRASSCDRPIWSPHRTSTRRRTGHTGR